MADVYVIGVGLHPFGRFPESTFEDLTRMAISQALEDSGISFRAIEATFIGNVSSGLYDARRVVQQFGWTGIPITRVVQASASGSAAFREAYLMVAHEVFEVALVLGFEKMERGLLPGTIDAMAGRSRPVCTATAASHAEASAFLTPNDDSGSMHDAASPTSAKPAPAYCAAP